MQHDLYCAAISKSKSLYCVLYCVAISNRVIDRKYTQNIWTLECGFWGMMGENRCDDGQGVYVMICKGQECAKSKAKHISKEVKA